MNDVVTLAHGAGGKQTAELIDTVFKTHFSNPEFTASVIAAYARAAYRLSKEGQTGCRTVFDIAPSYLSAQEGEELRKHLL